jgi:hypothetical protein
MFGLTFLDKRVRILFPDEFLRENQTKTVDFDQTDILSPFMLIRAVLIANSYYVFRFRPTASTVTNWWSSSANTFTDHTTSPSAIASSTFKAVKAETDQILGTVVNEEQTFNKLILLLQA